MSQQRQPDAIDLMILLGVSSHQSIEEMAEKVGRQTSLVQYRLNRLINEGYISRPEKRKARSFRITEMGKAVLKQYGAKAQPLQ
jgi:predicted transcriptional regulator